MQNWNRIIVGGSSTWKGKDSLGVIFQLCYFVNRIASSVCVTFTSLKFHFIHSTPTIAIQTSTKMSHKSWKKNNFRNDNFSIHIKDAQKWVGFHNFRLCFRIHSDVHIQRRFTKKSKALWWISKAFEWILIS